MAPAARSARSAACSRASASAQPCRVPGRAAAAQPARSRGRAGATCADGWRRSPSPVRPPREPASCGTNVSPRSARPTRSTARGGDQPPTLGLIRGQDRGEAAGRQVLAELGPRAAVALAGALDAGGQVMPGQRRERHRMTYQDAVQPVIRRHHVEQPVHRCLLETRRCPAGARRRASRSVRKLPPRP